LAIFLLHPIRCLSVCLSLGNAALLIPEVIIKLNRRREGGIGEGGIKGEGLHRKRLEREGLKGFVLASPKNIKILQ
jgi:hypothetical protein